VPYLHFNVLFVPEILRRSCDQALLVIDDPADVVGNASGGIGGMGPPFKDGDLHIFVTAACRGSGAHPCGIASDDDESFLRHDVLLIFWFKRPGDLDKVREKRLSLRASQFFKFSRLAIQVSGVSVQGKPPRTLFKKGDDQRSPRQPPFARAKTSLLCFQPSNYSPDT
jgi:hypothetical protein